jgi:hypothetical protein
MPLVFKTPTIRSPALEGTLAPMNGATIVRKQATPKIGVGFFIPSSSQIKISLEVVEKGK